MAETLPRDDDFQGSFFAVEVQGVPLAWFTGCSGISVEFVELRDAETLGPYSADRAAVLAVSASVGGTNLIDNVVLAPQITAAPRKLETWSH